MSSVFFVYTVKEEVFVNLYDAFHHLGESLRRSRNYAVVICVQHAPHRTTNIFHSRLWSHRRRRFLQVHQSARMTGSSLNRWRATVHTAAKKMLNNSGGSTHPCHSPCSTWNQSKQTPSSGCTQALIPSQYCWTTAIIWWYSDASEYLPQDSAVNGGVRLLL